MSVRPLKIGFIASEVYPYSKTGGLADVAGTLPAALRERGHDVRIFTPCYRTTKSFISRKSGRDIRVPIGDRAETAHLVKTSLPQTDVPVYLIKCDPFYDRPELYGEHGSDYPDNDRRFAFLCRAALEAQRSADFIPDVEHLNDWQTGPVAALLQEHSKRDPTFRKTATLYTIHNLEFQGLFSFDALPLLQLGPEYFTPAGLEFHRQASFAKGGLVYASKINTVSPTYRDETLTPDFGCGLDGLLRSRADDYTGILNGIDYSVRNPRNDRFLPANYGPEDLSGKAICKAALQNNFLLPADQEVPLLGFVGRMTRQKGLDLITDSLSALLAQQPLQAVFLGTGDPAYHDFFGHMRDAYPEKVGVMLRYDEELSRRVYAGADLFLMPSQKEPCGLAQMIAMRYGTPPIVTRTGGLSDTVRDFSGPAPGNGFVFGEHTPPSFIQAVERAVAELKNKTRWGELQRQAMAASFPWSTSAQEYEALYVSALQKIGRTI